MVGEKNRMSFREDPVPEGLAAARVRTIEELIARPPDDVIRLRRLIQRVVAAAWQRYVPPVLGAAPAGLSAANAAKIRFLAEMYSRACYSMIVLSDRCPLLLRIAIRCPRQLRLPRAVVLSTASGVFSLLDWLLPARVHRQLALMATMIGLIDQLLDDATANGPDEASQIALLLTAVPEARSPLQSTLQTLVRVLRANESVWQGNYWTRVLLPATQRY